MNLEEFRAQLEEDALAVFHVSREEIVPAPDEETGLGGVYVDTFYVYKADSPPNTCTFENTKVLVVRYGLPQETVFKIKEKGPS